MPAEWYEVQAAIAVKADSGNDAIDLVATAIRDRQRPGAVGVGIFPVGSFNATPTDDPTAGPGRGPKLRTIPDPRVGVLREALATIVDAATKPTAGLEVIESPINRLAGVAEEARLTLERTA